MAPLRELNADLRKFAEKEINEDPKRIKDDIAYIKEWLNKQPYINARTDDQFLISFLRGSKYSLERTKEKLDTYFTMKTLLPEFYSNRDPLLPELQEVLKFGVLLPLPKTKDSTSPRVVLLRQGFENMDIVNVLKINLMIGDILLLEDDNINICGEYILQDMKLLTLTATKMFSPTLVKKASTCFQNAYPVRPKGIFFFNTNSFFELVYSLFKTFMKEKMKKRVKVFGDNYEELYKIVPQRLWPKEYGGDGETLEELAAYWKKKVESYRDYFMDDEKYKTDESKRPGKPMNTGELFGIEGSFRKLNVD